MPLAPTHPARLIRLLLLGAGLPLLAAMALVGLGGLLITLGFASEEPLFAGAGIALLLLGVPALLWLFRTPRPPVLARVQPEEAMALHELLQRVAQGVKGVESPRLWIIRGFSVHLHTRPILGPLGWASHGWVIGLFAMMHLSPREMEATLLWDQAYWSRQHGWLNLEVKRVLQFWIDLDRALEARASRPGAGKDATRTPRALLRRVAAAFRKASNAFLFDQIFMADRSVAQALGPQTTAQMLLKEASTRFVVDDLWWPTWLAAQGKEGTAPEHPLQDVQDYLKRWPKEAVELRIQAVLRGDLPGPAALKVRLEALGVPAAAPNPPQRSAYEALLAEAAPDVCRRAEEQWNKELRDLLQRRVQREGEERAQYRVLLKRAEQGERLSPPDHLKLARLAVSQAPETEIRARLDALTEALPRSGDAWTLRARHLLPRDEAEGRAALERLRALHPMNAAIASELWADHLERTEPGETAREARLEAYRLARRVELAREERKSVTLKDPIAAHRAPEDVLESLRTWLASIPEVKQAFLVRKRVIHLPESPVYFLAIVPKYPWWLLETEHRRAALQKRLARSSPALPDAKLFLVVLSARLRRHVVRFKSIEDSRIYRRSSRR